jgi:hypothetical protein
MQLGTWTSTSIKFHLSALKQQIPDYFAVKESYLREAQAFGLGFNTEAALAAALKSKPELSARAFSDALFTHRLAELSGDSTAEVVAEVLNGIGLDIAVIKRSELRQRAAPGSDIAYDVSVNLTGIDTQILEEEILFHIPEFGQGADREPYRVDSAHDRRAEVDYVKTRFGSGLATVAAKLVEGHWYGGFYVYAPEHQASDVRCIHSLKVALARAILPRIPTRVRCTIFKPDNYEDGAWRVEVRLPTSIQRFWNGSPFQFDIPQLPKRFFKMPSGFRVDHQVGCFVDGIWKADLYSTGVEEARNPTPVEEVKSALLQSINRIILRAGYFDEDKETPILDKANKMVGGVQVRNGKYEAWKRERIPERPGNSHKLLGVFESFDAAVSAISDGL